MSLTYDKCDRCRADRQKCLPESRVWPSKCHRCENKKLPCSEPRSLKPGRPKRKKVSQAAPDEEDTAEVSQKRKRDYVRPLSQEEPDEFTFLHSMISAVGTHQQPEAGSSSRFPDWVFLLSWYPMLKQAMSKLKYLNGDIFRDFCLEPIFLHPSYKTFEKFTEELVPVMLRQATESLTRESQHRDRMALPEMLVRLLGDCINKPLPEVKARCMVCSSVPDHDGTFRAMLAQNGDLVNELHLRVFQLSCHMLARKTRRRFHHGCDDTHYVQSELQAIGVLFRQITARINDIFNDGATGLNLPPTLRKSAIFIHDYGGVLDDLFIGEDYPDCLGRTALHRVFDLPLQRGIDWKEAILRQSSSLHTCTDMLGRSPLHIAVRNGLLKLPFGTLRERFIAPNVNIQTVYGHTCLHYAVLRNSFSSFGMFTDLGLDPNLTDIMGKPAFSYLVKSGGLQTSVSFLDAFDTDLYWSKAPPRLSPLGEVIRYGRMDILEHLRRWQKIDPNVEDTAGETPIHWAIAQGSFASLELLGTIEGVQWDKPNHLGYTALHYAACVADERILRYILIRSEATDVNRGDNFGVRPLHRAALRGHYKNVKLLLENDTIDVNAHDPEGRTPLMTALAVHSTRVLKLLLKDKRVNLDLRTFSGRTALDIAHEAWRIDPRYRRIVAFLEAQTPYSQVESDGLNAFDSFFSGPETEPFSDEDEEPEFSSNGEAS